MQIHSLLRGTASDLAQLFHYPAYMLSLLKIHTLPYWSITLQVFQNWVFVGQEVYVSLQHQN